MTPSRRLAALPALAALSLAALLATSHGDSLRARAETPRAELPTPTEPEIAAALAVIRAVPIDRPGWPLIVFDPTLEFICENRSQWACRMAHVRLWRRGDRTRIDAVDHELQKACAEGDAIACGTACLLLEPSGLTADPERSRRYARACQLACDRGDTMVCGQVDSLCHADRTLLLEPERVCEHPVTLLEAACDRGSATACVRRVSQVPYIGSVPPTETLVAFLRACRLGQGTACSGAVSRSESRAGRVVVIPPGTPSGSELDLRACADGPRSHSCRGYCSYAAAQPSPVPQEELVCDRACAQTPEPYCDTRASLDLARASGPDDRRIAPAIESLRHACDESEQADACRRLASEFETGRLVPRDVPRANRYRRLAERYDRDALTDQGYE